MVLSVWLCSLDVLIRSREPNDRASHEKMQEEEEEEAESEPALVAEAKEFLAKWRSTVMTPGTKVDLQCPKTRKYLAGKIVDVVDADHVKVHYDGWGARYDLVMEMTSETIMPYHTESVEKKRAVKKQRKVYFHVSCSSRQPS